MTGSSNIQCYHCARPVPPGTHFSATILDESRPMCCPGCAAVAQAIVSHGLQDYYRFRDKPAEPGALPEDTLAEKLAVFDEKEVQDDFVTSQAGASELQLTIEGITCAACGWLIERQLSKYTGVLKIAVNVHEKRAWVRWDPQQLRLSQILQQLRKTGYHAYPFAPDTHEQAYKNEHTGFLKRLGLAGLMTMQVMMLMAAQYFDWLGNMSTQMQQYFHWTGLLLTTPVVIYSGSRFYVSAIKALQMGSINMDVPVTLAIFITFGAGVQATLTGHGEVYFESICMFIFLLLLSRFVEHKSRYQAMQISANMLKYMPVSATRLTAQKTWQPVLARKLRPDDCILVKAGETLPADGTISEGSGIINEAMLSGEFEPVHRTTGQTVYGGTVLQSGVLQLRVTKTLKDSLVNQILNLQAGAMADKPRQALQADKLARYFVVAVLLIATLTFIYWWQQHNDRALWITVAVLVATCPCALGLATPTALTCAMARLNRSGILIRRTDVLEQLTSTTLLAMDKTGTLTNGCFSITAHWYAPGFSESICRQLAASLEQYSDHPVAGAFTSAFQAKNHLKSDKTDTLFTVTAVLPVHHQGIQGQIDGCHYVIGAPVLHAIGQLSLPFKANVLMSRNNQVIAAWQVTDTLKADSARSIGQCPVAHKAIVSGDGPHAVSGIADELGISDATGGLTPQDKLARIKDWQQQGHRIMMLGDGINDAPVLAAADISVTVGNATDIARASADVILLSDQLSALPLLFSTARKTRHIIQQNMAWALGYNLLVLPLAVSGILLPWMAVVGMSLSSIIVALNSARLIR